jgi:hypothetical protein
MKPKLCTLNSQILAKSEKFRKFQKIFEIPQLFFYSKIPEIPEMLEIPRNS